ncbi:hypothetical protein Tco_0091218 [Tanacetum coccineum]
MTHPLLKINFVPRVVLMKSRLKTLNTARQNSLRAAVSVNTARPINTAYPKPIVNCARPALNVFNRAHSHVRRPFNMFTSNKNSNFNEKVNTVKGNVTTVGPKAVVSDEANAVKASTCWVWRPKQKVLDHGNPQLELQEKGVIDSGCSRHMTGNKSYLSDYEEIDGGFVAFGGDPKGGKITGKGKISTGIENLIDLRVKVIRCDNGTEFKNIVMNQFCKMKGRKPALSFMRPFGCPVTILNTIDHLDALTNSMNYKPVVVGNQSNGNAGTKACDNAGKARVETVPGKDYILLPLWTQDPPFSSSSKDYPDAGFKPSREEEKKDAEDPENESENQTERKDSEVPSTKEPRINQEKDDNINSTNNINTASDGNSTNNVNVVSSTVNAAGIEVNVVDPKTSIKLPNDPNMPELEDIVYLDDEDVGAEADMNNLDAFMLVSPILTTRIHKDHPVD